MNAKQHQAAWDALRFERDRLAAQVTSFAIERSIRKMTEARNVELLKERDELAAQVEATNALMDELIEQLGERESRKGDAPGHSHQIPGVWDSDNGALAGKPCAWCATWKHAKAMRSSPSIASDILRQRDARVLLDAANEITCGGIVDASEQLRSIANELEKQNG